MSHPIDVGSVLGGRYKVTATVLTSHDQDLVLDGVDQVLNRPVSILVAGQGNADQVAQSAREVATGERPGSVQILDLGVSDATTYLITNHTSAADLLDLVVASHTPYVEPFFTDTLGSEIFGQPRSKEPETYDGLYDDEEVDAGVINYHNVQPATPQRPATQPSAPPRPARPASAPSSPPSSAPSGRTGASAAGAAAEAAGFGAAAASGLGTAPGASPAPRTAAQPEAPSSPPQSTVSQPVSSGNGRPETVTGPAAGTAHSPAESPKVSLWAEDDYDYPAGSGNDSYDADGADARSSYVPAGSTQDADTDYDDEPKSEPRSMRWLVGGLLAAVLIVGLVFAVGNLGSLFKSEPKADPAQEPVATAPQASGEPTQTENAAPAGPPAVEGVTRLGNFDFAATYDGDLSKTFDGNAASYWSDMEFATDNWGGLATDGVSLVAKLKSPSRISSITLSQLGASGGSISVLTNDRPSLDGAKQVGTNSFTSLDLTIPLSEPVNAQYVIVSIKTLPKLAAPKTRFGYGLRLAEIKVQ
ncbi:ABC transporter substrate-binding protein [Arthrobacter sp.]|uniref:ABC transporter substrate-binding protein n=1 Tax=Arthrobacter sp. TaxID=1667 RepID=UPI0028119995|nr:ABC transporter substrate-binding protein [Arthrobacter sp.]